MAGTGDQSSFSEDFVAGELLRSSFSEFGAGIKQRLRFGVLMLQKKGQGALHTEPTIKSDEATLRARSALTAGSSSSKES